MMKCKVTSTAVLTALTIVTVACARASDRDDSPERLTQRSQASDDAETRLRLAQATEPVSHESPARTKQQKELDEAIKLMRAQGVPQDQIEQFRRAAQSFVHMTPTESARKSQREERRARRAADEFEQQSGDAPTISITLGQDSYQLTRTVCKNEPDNFRVAGTGNEESLAARFSYTRERLTDTLIQSSLRLNVGDRDVKLQDTAPWNYRDGVYRFSDEVSVRSLFGPTGNRQQRTETMRLTIEAPC
ncbi:MAG: hypothetical protein AAF385_02710 [Pseudomonadota bacterium]